MRVRLAYLLIGAAAGCSSGTPDPCSGVSGNCISARVEGNATGLDQLRFDIVNPSPASAFSPTTPSAFSLPVKVGLTFPGMPSSLDVTVVGISGGNEVASDKQTVTLTNGRGNVKFTLNSGTAPDMSLSGMRDMEAPPDLHSPPPIVVGPTGVITGYELDQITVPITASDPLMQPVTATLTNTPMGSTVDVDGGLPTLVWTPDGIQAGNYDVTINVAPQDSARAFMQNFTVRVLNAVDVVFHQSSDSSTAAFPVVANPIGDFDGDGFGDLAYCSVTSNVYTVTVLYGAATGLPTMPTAVAAQTKQYTISQLATPASGRVNCVGGDFDGDGKSDILVVDPAANGGKGMIYVVFGTDRTPPNPKAILQALNPSPMPANEKLGTSVIVGDFNGDGIADFWATNGATATNDIIYKFKGAPLPPSPTPIPMFFGMPDTSDSVVGSTEICNRRTLLTANNIDGDGAHTDEALVFDPNLGYTSDCTAANIGGVTVIGSGGPTRYQRPNGAAQNWGAQATLCDVDDDGSADLLVADTQTSGYVWVLFSNAGTLPNTTSILDGTQAVKIQISPTGHDYGKVKCVRNFAPGAHQTALAIDPGNLMQPSRVDVLSKSRTPMVARSLPVPGAPPDPLFGSALGDAGDINGDGLNDVLIGAGGSSASGKFWIVYGR